MRPSLDPCLAQQHMTSLRVHAPSNPSPSLCLQTPTALTPPSVMSGEKHSGGSKVSALPYLALQILQRPKFHQLCQNRHPFWACKWGPLADTAPGALPCPQPPLLGIRLALGVQPFAPICHALLPLPKLWSPTAAPGDSEIINFPLTPLWAFQIHF